MKTCRRYSSLISRYIDNDLAVEEIKLLEQHMLTCSHCIKTLIAFRSIKRLFSNCCAVPAATTESPEPLFELRKSRGRILGDLRGWRLAAISVLAVILAASVTFRPKRHHPEPYPVVMQNESRKLLNTPLGAIMYYEELAGSTIHAQYTRVAAAPLMASADTVPASLTGDGYKSPLFNDNYTDRYIGGYKNASIF